MLQACKHGDNSNTELLIEKGADVNGADYFGWTALHYASWSGSLPTVEMPN